MRSPFLAAVFSVAVITACSDAAAPSSEPAGDQPSFAAGGSQTIPISFVTQFSSFLGAVSRTHGASGRSRTYLCLAFSVQEGDLEGTLEGCFSANDPSAKTASHGPNGFFSTISPGYSEYNVCMPATGWCGTFSDAASVGKVYPQPRGVEFNNSVAMGGGDFEGMKLKGTLFECADSQGDRGCFTGYLLIPGGR